MRIKKTPLWYLAGDCTSILLTLTNKLSHVKSRTAANYHLLTRVKFNTGKVFCQKFMIGCLLFWVLVLNRHILSAIELFTNLDQLTAQTIIAFDHVCNFITGIHHCCMITTTNGFTNLRKRDVGFFSQ